MNDAPWKTARAWSRCTLTAGLALLVALAACGGGDGGGGGRDTTGGPDVGQPDTGGPPPVDVVEDTPPADTGGGEDVPPAVDVPPTPVEITFLDPPEDEAVRRADPTDPVVFRVSIEHPSGIKAVEFGTEGQEGLLQVFVDEEHPDGQPGGEFTFALDDFYVPDDEPAAGPDEVQRRWPHEGPRTFYVKALPVDGLAAMATRTIYIDETPPELVLTDAPQDRGLEVLDVVGQARFQFHAGDTHAMAGSRVFVDDVLVRELFPTETGDYIVVFEVHEGTDLAHVRIEAEDQAGFMTTLSVPVRIVKRPPYRLGHTFEFGGGVVVTGFVVGHYDDSDAYPDLWVSTTDGLWLLLGTTGGGFSGGYKLLGPELPPAFRLFLHDFDGDGPEDLLLVSEVSGGVEARVAIRIPHEGENVDQYRPYTPQLIEGGTRAVAFDLIDMEPDTAPPMPDPKPDLVVGLSGVEDSVAVLLGLAVSDLPLDVPDDPLTPRETCDPECSAGRTCWNGYCVLPWTGTGTCDDPVCEEHEICFQGAACVSVAAPDLCVATCGVGESCVTFARQDSEDRQTGCVKVVSDDCDPECASPDVCHFGQCVLYDTGGCDPPCRPDETCHNGVCLLRTGGTCEPACGSRQVCQFGTCVLVDPAECEPQCWGGELCHGGQCVRHCTDEGCGGVPDEPPFFLRPHLLRGVSGVTDVEVADFNNDGINDIVAGRTGVRQVSCFLGVGDGDFLDAYDTYMGVDTASPTVVLPVLYEGGSHDTNMDLVVAMEENPDPDVDGPTIFYLLGDGTGFFEVIESGISGGAGAAKVSELVPGDIMGQPSPDFVAVLPGASGLMVFRYQATSEEPYSNVSTFSAGFLPADLSIADMDADGENDLVYRNDGTARIVVGLSLDPADFDLPPEVVMPQIKEDGTTGLPIDIALGPVKTDDAYPGDDLVVLTEGEPVLEPGDLPGNSPDSGCAVSAGKEASSRLRVVLFPNVAGKPSNREITTTPVPIYRGAGTSIALGNFDSDTAPDLAIGTDLAPGDATIVVYTGCLCETNEAGEEVCVPDPEKREFIQLPSVAVLHNQRDGTFEPNLPPGTPWIGEYVKLAGIAPFHPASEVFAHDLNGDNRDDLIVMGQELRLGEMIFLPEVSTWRAPANLTEEFSGPRSEFPIGNGARWATVLNINPQSDTFLDILLSNTEDHDVAILQGTGNLVFGAPRFLATQQEPLGVAGALLDGADDDHTDFVVVVQDNVQIAFGKAPAPPATWAFEDVVFLYPGEAYPREDPQAVLIEDLNRDGRLDIVTTNKGSDTATIFFGVGERLFPVYLDSPTGHGPVHFVDGDLNGDACPDYAIENQDSHSITFLLSLPAAPECRP